MNLEDSEFEVTQINLRNKGTRSAVGRVHKGCVKDAFTKLSIGSIPSNYESIIYHHEQRKGFGTGQKRFESNTQIKVDNENDFSVPIDQKVKAAKINVSHSAKGYGPLIAKEKREWLHMPHSPGPGKYFGIEQVEREQRYKRKIYIKQREDIKRRQIVTNKENKPTPGPGSYEVQPPEEGPGWKSSFITRNQRQAYIPKSYTPGPGCYTADAAAKQEKCESRQFPSSELYARLNQEKRPKSKLCLLKKRCSDMPGPGFYDYQLPNFKPLYERIKISSNFMQTTKDRFNDPVDRVRQEGQEGPTPHSYQIPSLFDSNEKKLIDMSCFMSESKRNPFYGIENKLGPNLGFDGSRQQKKNYHFSIVRQWL